MFRDRRLLISFVTMIFAVILLALYFISSYMYGVFFGHNIGSFLMIYPILGIIAVMFCWYISKVRRSNDI